MWRIALAALVLSACVSPNTQGATLAPSGFHTDAADMGEGRWHISCVAAMSACTWRAQQLCPRGFDPVNTQQTQTFSGGFTQYGGGFGTQQHYTLMVQCRS